MKFICFSVKDFRSAKVEKKKNICKPMFFLSNFFFCMYLIVRELFSLF